MRIASILTFLGWSLLFCSTARADDWPQWRGPNRDGVWREKGIVEKFSGEQLKIKWRAKIAGGYSGPTVADGRVFVTDRLVEPKQIERIHAFDQKTGDVLWTKEYDCPYVKVGYQAGPRASVSVDGPRAYALGTMGHLFCLETKSGNVIWQKDLNTEYKIEMPIWGIASSPLIDGDRLIVQVGGHKACLVAFDKVSGKEIWRALDDHASYSSPIIIEQAKKHVLVCWTGDNVAGLDPVTGAVHWKHPFKPKQMVINCPTPVYDGQRLFLSSFYDGSLLLKIDQQKLAVEPLWRRIGKNENNTDALHCMIGTPIIKGEHIYGVDSFGELRCLDMQKGDRVWTSQKAVPKARWSTIHMVEHRPPGGQDDRTFMFNERGELIIARLSPEGYEEISRSKLIEPTTAQLGQRNGVCWAHPAYAGRHVFARNDQELVCASLATE